MKKTLLIILLLIVGCGSYWNYYSVYQRKHQDAINEFTAKEIPFMIYGIQTNINSACGVSVSIYPHITTHKIIKYIEISVSAYNAVGDKVYGSIRQENTSMLKKTGPLSLGDPSYMWKWVPWYNCTVHCIEMLSVKVEYMDGGFSIYGGEDLEKLYAPEKYRLEGRWNVCNHSPQ